MNKKSEDIAPASKLTMKGYKDRKYLDVKKRRVEVSIPHLYDAPVFKTG